MKSRNTVGRLKVVHEVSFLDHLRSDIVPPPPPPADEQVTPATRPSFRDFIQLHNPTLLDHEHVRHIIPVAEKVLRGEIMRLMVFMPPRHWKALADDTPIPTPSGWTSIGGLRPGDHVFAADGTPTTVLAVQHWKDRPTYRVDGADGDVVYADHEHLWKIRVPQGGGWAIRTSREIAEAGVVVKKKRQSVRRLPRIPLAGALDLPDIELPIPPYTLGAWLGDGTSANGALTIDVRDQPEIRRHVEADGYVTGVSKVRLRVPILGLGGAWDRATSLTSALRRTGLLGNKHIPDIYFRASVRQRLSLLQGLMDTDGRVTKKGGGYYSSSDERLARQVQELVWTLGQKASLVSYKGINGPAYRVLFFMANCARLERKARHCRDPIEINSNRPIALTPGPTRDTTCIMVANPDGLFLAGRSMMVTHNSEIFSRLLPAYHMRWWDEKAAIICHADHLALEFSEDARNYFHEDGGRMVPGTESKSRWASTRGGQLWAAGLGAGILGKGFHLGILDDPMDPEQVLSVTYQRRFRRFWAERYLPRQEPRARIILVMQRLGTEDPADFLFRREVGENVEKAPEHWHVLVLDEIHSEEPLGRWTGPKGLPLTCTLEPDWRKPGELLAPGRFTPEETQQLRIASGPLVTAAQRQQRPMKPSGDFWQLEWFRTYKELPPHAYDGGRDWDTAYTKEEANSASAQIETYRGRGEQDHFPIYIHDVDWRNVKFPELVEWMKSLTGPHYIEEKASGKSAAQSLAAADITANEVAVKGDKFARASAVQRVVANHRVFVREDIFDMLLRGEVQGLLRVSVDGLVAGVHGLDVNDVFVQALTRHMGLHAEKKHKVRFR